MQTELPIIWLGESLATFKQFPDPIKSDFCSNLYSIQHGFQLYDSIKSTNIASNVYEITHNDYCLFYYIKNSNLNEHAPNKISSIWRSHPPIYILQVHKHTDNSVTNELQEHVKSIFLSLVGKNEVNNYENEI